MSELADAVAGAADDPLLERLSTVMQACGDAMLSATAVFITAAGFKAEMDTVVGLAQHVLAELMARAEQERAEAHADEQAAEPAEEKVAGGADG
jgi:hypothetical protein